MGYHFFQAVIAHWYNIVKYIELTQGGRAIVDDEDFERINHLKWYLSDRGYALHKTRTIYYKPRKSGEIIPARKGKITRMHRFILNTPEGMVTDHINGDKLDNRKENLRYCTQGQNLRNQRRTRSKSVYKGVKETLQGSFQARIQINKKQIYLGNFKTPIEAARAYNDAAIEHHGEFAYLNKI